MHTGKVRGTEGVSYRRSKVLVHWFFSVSVSLSPCLCPSLSPVHLQDSPVENNGSEPWVRYSGDGVNKLVYVQYVQLPISSPYSEMEDFLPHSFSTVHTKCQCRWVLLGRSIYNNTRYLFTPLTLNHVNTSSRFFQSQRETSKMNFHLLTRETVF